MSLVSYSYGPTIGKTINTYSYRIAGSVTLSDGLYGTRASAQAGPGSSPISLANLANEAAIWGKGIPISWGLRKLRGYMLQCTAVRQEVEYTDFNLQQTVGNGYYNYTITTKFKYVVDYAFALGYPGDGGQPKQVLRVWQGDNLIYQNKSGQTRNQQLNFYPGSQTQLPDPSLLKLNPDQLAYRGLMYGVLTGFDATQTAGQIPDIFVEVADSATVSMPKTAVNESAYASSFRVETTLYDSREGFLYTVATLPVIGLGVAKFDSTNGQFLGSQPIWNNTIVSPAFNGFDSASTCGFVGDGPTDKYMIGQSGSANCKPFTMVNMETGQCVATIGFQNSFPNVDADIYGQWTYNQIMKFVTPQRTRAFMFGYSVLFGADAALIKVYDNVPNMKRLAHPGVFSGGSGSVFPGHIDDSGNCYFYFCHGTAVDRYMISPADVVTATLNWYTGAVAVTGGLRATDGDPVFFLDNGSGTTAITKLSKNNSATVIWAIGGNPSVPGFKQLQMINRGEYGGKEVFWPVGTGGGTIKKLDLMSGVLDSTTDTAGFTWSTVSNPPIWDSIGGNFININSPTINFVRARSYVGTRVNLSQVLSDLCVYCGYNLSDISISGISDQITGAIITPPFNLRDVLTNLSQVYNFEVFEVDGKITIKRRARGGSFTVDKTIPEADRAVLEEGGDEEFPSLKTARSSDDDLPSTVTLTYIDPNYDYNPVTYTWKRPAGVSLSTSTAAYTVPIIMTESEAGALVSQMIFDIFSGRNLHEFRLGTKYLQLAPGDIVKLVSSSGYTDTVKIEQVTVNGDFSQSYVAQAISSDLGPVYNPDPFVYTAAPDLNSTGKGTVVPIDTPYFPWALNQQTQLETFLIGMPAERGTWVGGIMYRADDGVNFGPINAVESSPTYGRLNFVFATDTSPNSIHYGQSFDLTLTKGAVTDFVAPAGGGGDLLVDPSNFLLFYGAPGRWEVMAFGSVVQDAVNNKVTLGDYIRGLYGTDVNVNNHQLGDMMILYNAKLVVTDRASITDLNKPFKYKIAAPMYPLQYSVATQITFQGNSDRPWAPSGVKAVKTGSDVVLSWEYRDRSETTIRDSTGAVTLQGDDLNVYDIEIYSGTTLKRTITNNAGPSYTYLSADIATDGFTFSTLTQLRVIVYQKSSTLGRGFGRDVTVDVQ